MYILNACVGDVFNAVPLVQYVLVQNILPIHIQEKILS